MANQIVREGALNWFVDSQGHILLLKSFLCLLKIFVKIPFIAWQVELVCLDTYLQKHKILVTKEVQMWRKSGEWSIKTQFSARNT
jgi:hypothetical protein